jgi:tetratricopeptide (TPR) repeat protein
MSGSGRAETQAPAFAAYRTRDAARVLGVSPKRVRTLVHAGVCQPLRRRRRLAFSFQDLVMLRAVQRLLRAKVPLRRVRSALAGLGHRLGDTRPVSAVPLYPCGRQVVVRQSGAEWCADSGQFLFGFATGGKPCPAGRVVTVRHRKAEPAAPACRARGSADGWFEHALALERKSDWAAACAAYTRALELNPQMAEAYINLGRLMHEAGDTGEATRLYHLALECAPEDPVAHYNLALALEDQQHQQGALAHYHCALDLDPEFADAHFNLGRLLQSVGEDAEGTRHLRTYKQLTSSE